MPLASPRKWYGADPSLKCTKDPRPQFIRELAERKGKPPPLDGGFKGQYSYWHPGVSAIINHHLEGDRQVVLAACTDLYKYPMMYPKNFMKGASQREQQFNRIGGATRKRDAFKWMLWGAGIGALVGVGIFTNWVFLFHLYIGGALGSAAGAWTGSYLANLGDTPFTRGMMRVFVNERASPITKAYATAQVQIWVPKVLMAHRRNQWLYKDGKPFLWLMLTYGQRINDRLFETLDYLALPNDPHFASNEAVYGRRNIDHMVSNNAADFGDVDKGTGETPEPPLIRLVKEGGWLIIIVAAVLIFSS